MTTAIEPVVNAYINNQFELSAQNIQRSQRE
jgi:hypothetical protein